MLGGMAVDHPPNGDPRPTAFPGFERVARSGDEVIRRLAGIRREQGLSQTQVAARMGTSQSAVARLESGQADARLSTLRRYAAALDVQLGFTVGPPVEDGAGGGGS